MFGIKDIVNNIEKNFDLLVNYIENFVIRVICKLNYIVGFV